MGKNRGSAPEPPDPVETARAEAQFNRADTYGPSGGGLRYGFTNADGQFEQGVAPEGFQSAVMNIESPTQRGIREVLEPASLAFTQRFVGDNVYDMPEQPRIADRGEIAQTIFDRNFSLMRPEIERGEQRLLTNLQARGLPVGSEAFNEARGDQQRQTEGTIARLAQDAQIGAGQEQDRAFRLEAAQRQNAMAELSAILGGSYAPPQNMPSGAVSPVNYSANVNNNYNQQLSAYNAQQEQRMATAGALGSLGSALIKSSRETKEVLGNVDQGVAATAIANLDLYGWRYKPEHAAGDDAYHIGPMAEDFHAMTGLGRSDVISVIDYLGVLTGALQCALHRIEALERDDFEPEKPVRLC